MNRRSFFTMVGAALVVPFLPKSAAHEVRGNARAGCDCTWHSNSNWTVIRLPPILMDPGYTFTGIANVCTALPISDTLILSSMDGTTVVANDGCDITK